MKPATADVALSAARNDSCDNVRCYSSAKPVIIQRHVIHYVPQSMCIDAPGMAMFSIQSTIIDMLVDELRASSPEFAMLIDQLMQPRPADQQRHLLRELGTLWFRQSGDPEVLAELGLGLSHRFGIEPGIALAEMLIAYGVARDEDHTRRWENHLYQRIAELRGLHRVISAANSTLDLDSSLRTVAETVAEVMSVEVCSIYLYDRHSDSLVLRATHGLNPAAIGQVHLGLGEGITGWAAEAGHPISIPDVRYQPRFHVESALGEDDYHAMLAVPIVLFGAERFQIGADKLQGVISVQTVGPHEFSKEDIDFVETVAGELAFYVVNAQLYHQTDEQLHQKLRELKTLQQIFRRITEELHLNEVLKLIVEKAVELARVNRADIFRYNEENMIELAATHGPGGHNGVHSFIDNTIRDGRPVAVLNAYNDSRYPELAQIASQEGFHSLFCMPLQARGRLIGGICLYTRDPRHFDYEQVQILSTFADEAAIVIENARLYEESQRALRIKSMMLQELHHRVRNNLQTISALLMMQLRRMEADDNGVAALRDSVARIQAIASVHNLLSRADVGATTVDAVVRQIVESAQVSLVSPDHPITFEVRGEAVRLGSRQATVLAIVVNELIANAIEHGLSAGGSVVVEIYLEDSCVRVDVCDDGPQHSAVREGIGGPGLGLQIIRTLVAEDLEGSFDLFVRDDGWMCARVRFPQQTHWDE